MIGLGSFYVQTGVIELSAVYIGIIVGILSASVLFINSFPDYDADRSKGRRSLVILLGKQKASQVFRILIIFPYILVIGSYISRLRKNLFDSMLCIDPVCF